MADIFKHRRDTAENWSKFNPVLLEGELGFLYDGRYKFGDGKRTWNELPLINDITIVQEEGDSEDKVMSQKAVTNLFKKLEKDIQPFNSVVETEIALSEDYIDDASYNQVFWYTKAKRWVAFSSDAAGFYSPNFSISNKYYRESGEVITDKFYTDTEKIYFVDESGDLTTINETTSVEIETAEDKDIEDLFTNQNNNQL